MQSWTPSLGVDKGYQLLIMLDICFLIFLKSVVKLPHKNVVPTQRDVWKKKLRGAMAMAQCVAASFALNALSFLLSCCVLSSEYLFQCFFLGVKIFFSCDEDNVPKLLQYAENVLYTCYNVC